MKKIELIKAVMLLNLPSFILVIFLVYSRVFVPQILPSIKLVVFLIGMILLSIILSYIFIAKMRQHLNAIGRNMQTLSDGLGEDNERIKNNIFFKSEPFNKLFEAVIHRLKQVGFMVENIASGKYEESIDLNDSKDLIVDKLLLLQQNLKENKATLEQTKIAEEQRNWSATGLAKFSDILRQDFSNIEEMGYSIISNLVNYIDANQGGLFVLDQENDNEICYELIAAVAYDRRKKIDNKIKEGEALVGRCAFEKKTIYMTDIPSDYVNISSGLGTANPGNLLLVPCMIEGKVIGIIEIASFHAIEDFHVNFIEKLGESIASSIFAVRNNERTSALLKASQLQSDELVAHEEELRQNLEEMETTQEDLRRQMEINATMRKELLFEKYLFDTLLNNIPARINFKDKNRKYIRASKSFLERFGKGSNTEIEGKTDVDFFGAEFAKKTMADELEIMNAKQGRINYIEHEVKDNGEEIWKNVTKIPLLDENDNCVGIFASVYDITEAKILEKQLASEKRLFDTLLNNIPARINFKDADRKYIRASKSFLDRFGKVSNDEIVGKTDVDFFGAEFAEKTMADELQIMKSGEGRINFIEHEIKENKEQIWKNVSKIPLIDDENNCFGIFASVYDITDFKLAELENEKLKAEVKKLKKVV